jgi:hypothetical protein
MTWLRLIVLRESRRPTSPAFLTSAPGANASRPSDPDHAAAWPGGGGQDELKRLAAPERLAWTKPTGEP